MTEEEIVALAKEVVSDWPPLDEEEKLQLANILRPGSRRTP